MPASGRSMTTPAASSRCSEKSKVSLDAAVVNILIPTPSESNLGMGLLLGEAFDCIVTVEDSYCVHKIPVQICAYLPVKIDLRYGYILLSKCCYAELVQ